MDSKGIWTEQDQRQWEEATGHSAQCHTCHEPANGIQCDFCAGFKLSDPVECRARDEFGEWEISYCESLERAAEVAAIDVKEAVTVGDYGRRAKCEGATLEVIVWEVISGNEIRVTVEVEGNGEAYDPESDD